MKLFVIGDSISLQYGPYLEQHLRGVFGYARKEGTEEALKDLDEAKGANGGPSTRVRAYMEAMAKEGGIDADLLLVNCGLHDIKQDLDTHINQVPLEEYREQLQAIITLARGMGLFMVWVRTTPVDDETHNSVGRTFLRFAADCEAYNDVADAVMEAAGVPSIDLFTFTQNLEGEVFRDHCHFHPEVCEKQAAYIAGWISNPAFLEDVKVWQANRV